MAYCGCASSTVRGVPSSLTAATPPPTGRGETRSRPGFAGAAPSGLAGGSSVGSCVLRNSPLLTERATCRRSRCSTGAGAQIVAENQEASVPKRRGRPRKEKPTATEDAETSATGSMLEVPRPASREEVDAEVVEEVETSAIPTFIGDDPSVSLPRPREDYHTIALDKCEFLIGRSEDDQLDLRQVFVHHPATGRISAAHVSGRMPSTPADYQEIEWSARTTKVSESDINYVQLVEDVLRVYLVKVAAWDPYMLDTGETFEIDGAKRLLSRCQVPGAGKSMDRPVLRITRQGLMLASEERLPTAEELIEELEDAELDEIEAKMVREMRTAERWIDPDKPYYPEDADVGAPPSEPVEVVNVDDARRPPPLRPVPRPLDDSDRERLAQVLSHQQLEAAKALRLAQDALGMNSDSEAKRAQ
eukprot:jgi/Chlat1/8699/Chrsp88S00669